MSATAWSVAVDGTPGPTLWECLHAATAAPSVHNTQPWLFGLSGTNVDIYADPERRLDVIDPEGREMMISLGAAVLNLRVAILARNRQPTLQIMPPSDDPNLVARVNVGAPVRANDTALALDRAIPHRHTNRRPFANVTIPDEVLAELAAAAQVEGAHLTIADAAGCEALLNLVRAADNRRRSQPGYWAEIAKWTLQTPGRRDGVPPAAFGPWSALETLPLRDFGLIQPARHRRVAHFEEKPVIAVLYTRGDTPRDWIRAGQAMERVLLTATVRGLATTMMSQPLETPELRSTLANPHSGIVAHALIRLGYGPPSAPSPRRPLDEVLIPWPAVRTA